MAEDTLPKMFRARAKAWGDKTAYNFRINGEWTSIGWDAHAQAVDTIAKGLIAWGVKPGDRIAILSNTRLEWTQFPERLDEITRPGGSLTFDLTNGPLRTGENEIELRLLRRSVQFTKPLVLRDVEITVEYE